MNSNSLADVSDRSRDSVAEYGVMLFDENGKKKRTVKFSSLERCQAEVLRHPGSIVVRLGRHPQMSGVQGGRILDGVLLGHDQTTQIPENVESTEIRFNIDELGSIETPQETEMRYNDICPVKIPVRFRTADEKEAWYDTPAGRAWVKENPIPSIFQLPTPEYIHRRELNGVNSK